MDNNNYNHRTTNNSEHSVMPNQSNAPFCAQDVLYTSTHDFNGLFVMMRQNFTRELGTHVRNAANEAIRYHKAVGLAHKDNVLPRIVSKLEHDTSFSVIASKIKALLELFELFHKEVGALDISTSTHETRAQVIITLLQQILALGENVRPVPR